MTELEAYYNKFNEEKRLDTRHGRVEFITSMRYIHKCLEEVSAGRAPAEMSVLDIGAGTGRYCVPLAKEGYAVSAVEPVRHNLGRLKKKGGGVSAFQGDARRLKRFADGSFDVTLLFGPMYHLKTWEDKLQALREAKRVTRQNGRILAAYVMNEFSVITYAFKERHILEAQEQGLLDEEFHCTERANPLYSMVRLSDIDRMNREAGLIRERIVAADGAANYIRPFLNALTEEEFGQFVSYHLATCESMELMGASGHTVDILRKKDEI
ncbi:MAG: methyltransferase domain-containing protein [Muribaculaceae bacterium]|nr:methyltransferase domain-containing protein [Roseburia sp.]MCM1430751.1 methyltransferase domain-containing protein [Muribaculaceae bacterium]MCM1492730.1 methyltransferase domain-containing protein [Muribaculaceae bacterium]